MNSPMSAWPLTGWAIAFAMLGGGLASGQVCEDFGRVLGEVRIGQGSGGLESGLQGGDAFGSGIASLGDLDGDGFVELAVGAIRDDDGGSDRGAVWILSVDPQHGVRASRKISATSGEFGGHLNDGDWFGGSVASLGDLDGDGTPDLAVGVIRDDDGGENRGAVWILFLRGDGTVVREAKISATQGGFDGRLDDFDEFGSEIEAIGDLDGDGVVDLAVGTRADDDGGANRGAVWILFLNNDGTVKRSRKISELTDPESPTLRDGDWFGCSIARLGDIDGDGVTDIAVGARSDDDRGSNRGAVWILFLETDGSLKSSRKISAADGGQLDQLDDGDRFGAGLTGLADLDGDGTNELLVSADRDDDGGWDRGGLWLLLLSPDGAAKSVTKISDREGSLRGLLLNGGSFGIAMTGVEVAGTGGGRVLAVGASSYDAYQNAGEIWLITLDTCQRPPELVAQPESVLLPPADGMAVLRVGAVGTDPLTYTWRRGGVPLENTRTILGVDSPTLTVEATEADEGVYDCVVSSAYGSVTSDPAVLGVIAAPRTADVNGDGRRDIFDVIAFFELFTS